MSDIRLLTRQTTSAPSPIPAPRIRWKSRILLPTLILFLVAGLAAFSLRDAIFPGLPVHVIPVIMRSTTGLSGTGMSAMSSGSATIQSPGWVEPDPYPVFIPALTDGVLEEVLVLEGQPVSPGQVVARMNADQARIALNSAQAELHHRQSDLTSAEARLNAAQKNWDNPIEANRAVASLEAQLEETRGMVDQSEKEVAAEQAHSISLNLEFQRLDALHGSVGTLEIEKAKQAMDAEAATLQATQSHKPILLPKEKQLESDLLAAKENLRLRITDARELAEAKAAVASATAMTASAQADLDAAKLRLDRMSIRALTGGVVMSRLKQPGETLMSTSNMLNPMQILRVYDPAHLQVRADVPLSDAAQIQLGMKAQIVVSVLPEHTFTGVVTRIVNEADLQKNTLQIKVRIDNPDPALKPEMLARVKFLPDEKMATTMPTMPGDSTDTMSSQHAFIPQSLIITEGPNTFVWIVTQKQGDHALAHRVAIMIGSHRKENWIEIESGLNAGDLLIADRENLAEGKKIRITGEMEMP